MQRQVLQALQKLRNGLAVGQLRDAFLMRRVDALLRLNLGAAGATVQRSFAAGFKDGQAEVNAWRSR